ncbi:MAG: hypothetical protein ABEH64_05545 [Salinirussus sp.]
MQTTATESAVPIAPDPIPDSAVRIVRNAVRSLIPDRGTLALEDLLAVVRLEPRTAAGAMDRLARESRIAVHRIVGEDRWLVRRTDRW